MGKTSDSIIVAVRVRPFNEREQKRNCKLAIEMPDEQTTVIRDPKTNEEKRFTYDHSYWSHDGFEEQKNGYFSPTNAHYADQKRVFEDLGRGVLANAWAGYNCSLFAYGQTGSGKSYSIVGFKNNKGIVPIVCEELFKQIQEKSGKKSNANASFEVFISMLEIYCEKVRDLLTTVAPPKGGLKVREHPKNGFYVENLTTVPVASFKEIEAKIEEGTKNRTIAATQMNATSSRAHTIVKITFAQKSGKNSGTSMKKSEINLVDLAGSERQSAAGTEGDRLKEGIVINQSLTTLGRVIKALHDQQKSKGSKKSTQIPYRDSVLTCLLKNALGGNSKTIMIAAISPADINYEETLSTLRFADRAKSIKTNAVINENQTEKAMRELREENARLQNQMGGDASQEEIEKLRQLLAQNQKEMEEMEKSWQQKIAEEAAKHAGGAAEKAEIEKKKAKMCHLWNLNEDPALTNVIVHFIPDGETVVGNKPTSSGNFIQMSGLSILPQHVLLKNDKNNQVSLTPLNEDVDILINGKSIHGEVQLQQNDRVFFGGNHLYVFNNPTKKGTKTDITYDMAQSEIAQTHAQIFNNKNGVRNGENSRDMILEEELMSTLPLVQRANAMAGELGRNVKFEIVLVSPEMRGLSEGLTEIWIKVHNISEDTYFIWEKSRFMNRYYGMQEMYEAKIDGSDDWNMPKERDPFYEPPDSPVFIASCVVFLQSLAYLIDVEEQFPIVDLSGQEIGLLTVGLSPCSTNGKELRGEYVENPHQLIGKNIAFKVKILSAIGLPRRILKSTCKYRFFGAKKQTQTLTVSGNSPAYGHEETFQFKPVTKELADYLANSNLYITFWGTQKPRNSGGNSRKNSVSGASVRSRNVREMPSKTKRIEKMVASAKIRRKSHNFSESHGKCVERRRN
ncbi:unnamed protein product [Caenorhabditis angaria]|uniref:Kinesin-like protein n=1 Tax=Caenorhabditis angaria TaxID=860376 RepID=A0A9P1MY80_9PELO|nr:unnamed protein product [Caenorhabditis angaria]